jgi:hypothetical protein
MTTRMTSQTVTFQRPFILAGFGQVQPPGSYTVETEEEQLDSISFPAWKRTMTIMHLKNGVTTEYHPIDPNELREALLRDEAQEDPTTPSRPDTATARRARARASRFTRGKNLT